MGREQEWITLADNARVSDLLKQCSSRSSAFETVKKNLLIAVNQEYAQANHPLSEGDEVALFPPVSGGTADVGTTLDFYAIIRDPIESSRIVQELKHPVDGAVVVFEGIVRNNSLGKNTRFVEYHAYEPMALKKIRELGEHLRATWQVDGIAIVHRLGHLNIGETSVLIAVTAPHRKPAFEACQFAIDTLKKTVPIWKKEFFEDGELWIEGDNPVKSCHE